MTRPTQHGTCGTIILLAVNLVGLIVNVGFMVHGFILLFSMDATTTFRRTLYLISASGLCLVVGLSGFILEIYEVSPKAIFPFSRIQERRGLFGLFYAWTGGYFMGAESVEWSPIARTLGIASWVLAIVCCAFHVRNLRKVDTREDATGLKAVDSAVDNAENFADVLGASNSALSIQDPTSPVEKVDSEQSVALSRSTWPARSSFPSDDSNLSRDSRNTEAGKLYAGDKLALPIDRRISIRSDQSALSEVIQVDSNRKGGNKVSLTGVELRRHLRPPLGAGVFSNSNSEAGRNSETSSVVSNDAGRNATL